MVGSARRPHAEDMTSTDPRSGPPDGSSPDPAGATSTGPTDPSDHDRRPPDAPRAFDARVAGSLLSHPEGLRRSRTDRKLAGVCAGLGRQLGIDPNLIRVLMVVLALTGGVGVPLYLVLWLVTPEEGRDSTGLTDAVGRYLPAQVRSGPGLAVLLGVVVLLGGLAVSAIADGHFRFGLNLPIPLLAVAAVVGYLVYRSKRSTGGGDRPRVASGAVPTTPQGTPAPVVVPQDPSDPGAPGTEFWSRPDPLGLYPASGTPTPAPVRRVRYRRAPIALVLATIALAGLSVAALAALDAAGAGIAPALYPTVPALVIGLGLLAASRRGGSRLLVTLGLLLGLATIGASRVDLPAIEQRTLTPTNLAAAQAIGTVPDGVNVVDLQNVRVFRGTPNLDLAVDYGSLRVVLPENLDATVTTSIERGGWDILGTSGGGGFGSDQGPGAPRSAVGPDVVHDTGSDGAATNGAALDLNLTVHGGGFVQVVRAP